MRLSKIFKLNVCYKIAMKYEDFLSEDCDRYNDALIDKLISDDDKLISKEYLYNRLL